MSASWPFVRTITIIEITDTKTLLLGNKVFYTVVHAFGKGLRAKWWWLSWSSVRFDSPVQCCLISMPQGNTVKKLKAHRVHSHHPSHWLSTSLLCFMMKENNFVRTFTLLSHPSVLQVTDKIKETQTVFPLFFSVTCIVTVLEWLNDENGIWLLMWQQSLPLYLINRTHTSNRANVVGDGDESGSG